MLQTFNVLLEADAFEELGDDSVGLQTYVLFPSHNSHRVMLISRQSAITSIHLFQKRLTAKERAEDSYIYANVSLIYANAVKR